MPEYPEDTESYGLLGDIMLGIAAALFVAPGVIWWAGTFIQLVTGARPW